MSNLVKLKFVKMAGYEIRPTERFRKGMREINRNVDTLKVGENFELPL